MSPRLCVMLLALVAVLLVSCSSAPRHRDQGHPKWKPAGMDVARLSGEGN
jgi:uncharacterized membrane protein YfcA